MQLERSVYISVILRVIPAIFAVIAMQAPVAYAQTVTRLTFNQGDDFFPAWDPRGVTIAYLREKSAGSSVFDAYKAESSGQAGEQAFLTGLNQPFGVATTTSWLGKTGFLVVEEAISGFEVLKFDTSQAPFNRTVTNGSDAANSLLLSIDGGGGGGLSTFSRNGLIALERFSTNGSGGTVTVRTGLVSSMTGQASSTFGTVLFSTTSGSSPYSQGGALSPDGSTFVVAAPSGAGYDLILGSTSNAFSNVNLTTDGASGVMNTHPDISPDGTKVIFARASSASATSDLYTINLDGTALTQVTDTPNFSENRPSWSPDGGSVAFDGVHLSGHESDAPALEAGESPNSNVYILTLPPVNTVTPKTKLTDPPLVTVNDHSATFIFAPFKNAQLRAVAKALLELEPRAAKTKTTFSYDLQIVKTGKKRQIIEKISARNRTTVRNLKPGTYTARYRVRITSKAPSRPAVVKNTGFSPRATFSVS